MREPFHPPSQRRLARLFRSAGLGFATASGAAFAADGGEVGGWWFHVTKGGRIQRAGGVIVAEWGHSGQRKRRNAREICHPPQNPTVKTASAKRFCEALQSAPLRRSRAGFSRKSSRLPAVVQNFSYDARWGGVEAVGEGEDFLRFHG